MVGGLRYKTRYNTRFNVTKKPNKVNNLRVGGSMFTDQPMAGPFCAR
jgi:hypothetical protein